MGGGIFTLGTIFIKGMTGLYCLVAISACMSLMFPTIYGIALKGLGNDAKLGSAGLIMAIGGGMLLPPLQGLLIDKATWFTWLSSIRFSFILSLICFIVIAMYGRWAQKYRA
jgi:FHS family L-fucose permease-like MFS transporter